MHRPHRDPARRRVRRAPDLHARRRSARSQHETKPVAGFGRLTKSHYVHEELRGRIESLLDERDVGEGPDRVLLGDGAAGPSRPLRCGGHAGELQLQSVRILERKGILSERRGGLDRHPVRLEAFAPVSERCRWHGEGEGVGRCIHRDHADHLGLEAERVARRHGAANAGAEADRDEDSVDIGDRSEELERVARDAVTDQDVSSHM